MVVRPETRQKHKRPTDAITGLESDMTDDPSGKRRRILFVDDEERVLQGIQRQLRPLRHEWDVQIALGGEAGLRLMESAPIDVVVSDMRMPGMDGAAFLYKVMERWPHTVRIVLSGQADRESIMRSLGATHQYLAKPCDPDRLRTAVSRACGLRDIIYDEKLQRLVSQMETIPSLPGLYQLIQAELAKPEPSIKQIGDIVAMDLGMSAKLLQLVNSARFGLSRQVNSPTEAASLLGVSTVKALVLSSHVFSELHDLGVPGLSSQWLWQHALAVGTLARRLAKDIKLPLATVEMAFTAGLLHDCGMLMLAANRPQDYTQALTRARECGDLIAVEREIFKADHAAVGAYLLGLWALPEPIVEAVAFHHRPSDLQPPVLGPLVLVHLAGALIDQADSTLAGQPAGAGEPIDTALIEQLGLVEQFEAWRVMAKEIQKGDGNV